MSRQLNACFDGLVPSSTLYINETVNRLWSQGHQAFHMGFGESRFEVHPLLQKALSENAHQKSYLPARGLPALCDAVASYYTSKLETPFTNQQVIIGPGSKALIYGLQAILNADLFLPTPSWVSYGPQATLLNLKHSYVPSKVEDGYAFDLQAFQSLVNESSNPNKLLVLNSPNNPTGQMMAEEQLQEIAEVCRANDIWVLSDEIYFQVVHGERKHVSIAKYYPEGTFVLGGLSKHLSIGGWRIGVALMPDTDFGAEVMNKMVTFASETWSGVTAPAQYAAIVAYNQNQEIENYVRECAEIHGIRTRFINQGLSDLGIRCSESHGAFYITANFDDFKNKLAEHGIKTSADLSKALIDRCQIATLPGSDFGIPAETLSLRLSTSYLDMEDSESAQRVYNLYQDGVDAVEFMSEVNHPNTNAAIQRYADFLASIV